MDYLFFLFFQYLVIVDSNNSAPFIEFVIYGWKFKLKKKCVLFPLSLCFSFFSAFVVVAIKYFEILFNDDSLLIRYRLVNANDPSKFGAHNNNNRVDVDINYYHCCVVVIFPPSICRLYSDDERWKQKIMLLMVINHDFINVPLSFSVSFAFNVQWIAMWINPFGLNRNLMMN